LAKVSKEVLLWTARRSGVFALTRRWLNKELRILGYHGIWTTPGYQYADYLFMTPEKFEQRMVWLKNSSYPVLPLAEAVKLLGEGGLPDNSVVITIDDGWASTYTHMLPVLEQLKLPATVYMTTWYSQHQLPIINVAVEYLLSRAGRPREEKAAITADINGRPTLSERDEALRHFATQLGIDDEVWHYGRQFNLMTLDEIGDAHRRGLDFQLHTHTHRWGVAPPERLAVEIAKNKAILASACSRPESDFEHFCYPSGYLNPAGDDVLKRSGIKSATMVDQGINPPGTHSYRLRRFLDGRVVSQARFEAYLSGTLEVYEKTTKKFSRWRG
jgi:peptidoglycan/xylan/chitin deacetylase (PgdA/CDA1 family)